MCTWIKSELQKVNRKKVEIIPSPYFMRKNVQFWEQEYIDKTIRYGKLYPKKSTYGSRRICFKLYFKEIHKTYFVVVIMNINFIKIITRYNENGKY